MSVILCALFISIAGIIWWIFILVQFGHTELALVTVKKSTNLGDPPYRPISP